MARELRSILRETPWFLIAKAATLAGLWLVLPWWLWSVLGVIIFYGSKREPVMTYSRSLAALLLIAGVSWYLPAGSQMGVVLWLGLAWGLILGLKGLNFLRKAAAYRLLQLLLMGGMLVSFFWWSFFSTHIFWQYLFLILISYWLFGELARVIAGERLMRLWGGLGTWLTVQTVYGLSLLPIEFINKAALAFLVVVATQEFLVRGERGKKPSPNFYLGMATVLTFLFLIVLAASSWEIS